MKKMTPTADTTTHRPTPLTHDLHWCFTCHTSFAGPHCLGSHAAR